MISNVAADVRAFTSNVFLADGDRPVLVDVGANFDLRARLADRPDPAAVVLTHSHPDHVGNLDQVAADVWGYDTDLEGVDHGLSDGDRIQVGDHEYEVLYTPGHAEDHVCLYAPAPGVLFAGDLVFADGGFGRTDLQGADRRTLIESIDRLLDRIDDCRELHAGHGRSVTGDAREHVELAARMARQF